MRAANFSLAIASIFQQWAAPLAGFTSTPANLTGPFCPGRPASSLEQKQIFDIFVQRFLLDKDITALIDHAPEDYLQNNKWVSHGRQAAIDFLKPIWDTDLESTIIHKLVADSTAVIHQKIKAPGSNQIFVIADFWRLDGTCIVEHWDVLQDYSEDAKNPIAMK